MRKIVLTILTLFMSICLVGCSNSNPNTVQAMTNIQETLEKVTISVKKLETISENDLLIKEFMRTPIKTINTQNQLLRYDKPSQDNTGYNGATFTNTTPMSSYVGKLQSLSEIATIAISSNNKLDYLKSLVISSSSSLVTTADQIKDKNCDVSNGQKAAINDLCSNLNVNLNKINLTKNELNSEIKSVKSLKNNYTNNIEQLSSKYTRLVNCLDTRIMYFNNMLTTMNGLESMLNDIYYPCCDIDNCEDKKVDKSNIKSNIDTYENAGKKNITNPNYYNNKYVNGYYRNPFYNGYYPQAGYRNGFGYGYGMGYGGYPHSPYTNYNPYMPNIDTFVNYTNVDSYKSINEIEEENKQEEESKQDVNNDVEVIKTSSKPQIKIKKYYTISEKEYNDYLEYKKTSKLQTS